MGEIWLRRIKPEKIPIRTIHMGARCASAVNILRIVIAWRSYSGRWKPPQRPTLRHLVGLVLFCENGLADSNIYTKPKIGSDSHLNVIGCCEYRRLLGGFTGRHNVGNWFKILTALIIMAYNQCIISLPAVNRCGLKKFEIMLHMALWMGPPYGIPYTARYYGGPSIARYDGDDYLRISLDWGGSPCTNCIDIRR